MNKIIFVMVDINSKSDISKITSSYNFYEYKSLCMVCSESIEKLIGEAFINYEKNIYVNLFCFDNGKFSIGALEKSYGYVIPQIKNLTKTEIIIKQDFTQLKQFLNKKGIKYKLENN